MDGCAARVVDEDAEAGGGGGRSVEFVEVEEVEAPGTGSTRVVVTTAKGGCGAASAVNFTISASAISTRN